MSGIYELSKVAEFSKVLAKSFGSTFWIFSFPDFCFDPLSADDVLLLSSTYSFLMKYPYFATTPFGKWCKRQLGGAGGEGRARGWVEDDEEEEERQQQLRQQKGRSRVQLERAAGEGPARV